MRRLVVDRALDDGRRVLEEYETDRAADEPKDSPRARIAQNLKRQIDTVSERWSMLCRRSEDWQHWIDEVLRVSTFHGTGTNCVRLLKGVSVTCAIFLDFGAACKTLSQKRGLICSNGQSICSRTMRLKYKER